MLNGEVPLDFNKPFFSPATCLGRVGGGVDVKFESLDDVRLLEVTTRTSLVFFLFVCFCSLPFLFLSFLCVDAGPSMLPS